MAEELLREAAALELAKYGAAPITRRLLDKLAAPPKRRRPDHERSDERMRPARVGAQQWERRWSSLRGRAEEIRKRTTVQVVIDEEDTLLPGVVRRRRIADDARGVSGVPGMAGRVMS